MTVLTKPFKSPFRRPFTDPFLSPEVGPFNPLQISDLEGWYDSSDPTTITVDVLNDSLVTDLADKSGNGNTVSAPGTADEPVTGVFTMNGRNVIRFDGLSDRLLSAAFPMTTASTTFIVYNTITSPSIFDSVYSFDDLVGTSDYQIDAEILGEFHSQVRSGSFGGTSISNPADLLGLDTVSTVKWSTANTELELRTNGSFVASTTYNGTMASSMTLAIGSNRAADQKMNMDFAEFVHYNKELSDAEILQVENYLGAKWGIFNPLQISALEGWYDADDPATITEAAGLVSALADKSGNGNTVSAGVGDEPLTNSNTMNGRNVLFFNGTDLLAANGFPMTPASTTFMVLRVFSVTNGNQSAWSFDAADRDYRLAVGFTAGQFEPTVGPAGIGSTTFKTPNDFFNIPTLVAVRWSTVNNLGELFVNGSLEATDGGNYTNNMNTPMVFRIAANRTGAGRMNMDFAECLHYNRELTNAEILQVERYFSAKWGV